jgi:cob(I)alamin adenosyltransferase
VSRRIDRVVTRGGDGGETSVADGRRLPKDHARIAALGAVDELNAHVGHLRAALPGDDPLLAILIPLQHRLFDVGGALAMPGTRRFDPAVLETVDDAVERLNAELPPLTNFVLPAGDEATSRAHLARTVCRRAERDLVSLRAVEPEVDDPALGALLNRTSDLLFVIARTLARRAGEEVVWEPAPRS